MSFPKIIISLDFELIWGVFDHFNIDKNKDYFDNTLYVIPQLLDKFAKNEIHVTWATVGMLGNENWDEWYSNIPDLQPTYVNKKLDAFEFGKQHVKSGLDRFFFAPQLINQICTTPFQELGSHTYSHYYCLEQGQTVAQFESDLEAMRKIFSKWDVIPSSLVFPRNQFNKSYMEVCLASDITSVRSNPENWYWDTVGKSTIYKKIFRSADAYFPLGTKSYLEKSISLDFPVKQPSSRFLRPQSSYGILNSLMLSRIKNEIMYAAKHNRCYHLWWHPHNFGTNPKEALTALDEIIAVITKAKEHYNLQSLGMKTFENSLVNVS